MNQSIKLGWEFSHVILDASGIEVHSATKHDEGSLIEVPSGEPYSDSTFIRTAVDHLAPGDYTLATYTEIRVNPPQGTQLFAEGEDNGEELVFDR